MNLQDWKAKIEEIGKIINKGKAVQIEVRMENQQGEKETLSLKVNEKESQKTISDELIIKPTSGNNRNLRGRLKMPASEPRNKTLSNRPKVENISLDLTSVQISDEEIEKVIEDASNQTGRQLAEVENNKIKPMRKPRIRGSSTRDSAENEHLEQPLVPPVILTLHPEKNVGVLRRMSIQTRQ